MGQSHIYIVLIFLESKLATDSITISGDFLMHVKSVLGSLEIIQWNPSFLLLCANSVSIVCEFVLFELLFNVHRKKLLYRAYLVLACVSFLLLELPVELVGNEIAIVTDL